MPALVVWGTGAEVTLLERERDGVALVIVALRDADVEIESEVEELIDDETEFDEELAVLELDGFSFSAFKKTLDDWQYSAIFLLYQLSNAPLLQRQNTVVPPIARLPFLHLEKPPV